MKKIDFISNRTNTVEGLDDQKSYLGKTVVSKSGEVIGKVKRIMLRGAHLMGLMVGSKLYIDREFVSSVAEDAVMLSIDPVTSLVGKQVFDVDGRKIGKVAELIRKHTGNDYDEILIKRGIFRKAVSVPKKDVDVSARNIILRTAID